MGLVLDVPGWSDGRGPIVLYNDTLAVPGGACHYIVLNVCIEYVTLLDETRNVRLGLQCKFLALRLKSH
jgi:hypothetical protein